MATIPRDDKLDSTLSLLSDGYLFISKRSQRYQSDLFETRLMLRRVICMIGEEASEVFYEPGRFTRRGAMPPLTVRLLQGRDSVQGLDGEAHHHRKAAFMSLMSAASIESLADTMTDAWLSRLERWEGMPEVVLHDEAREILGRAVLTWVGLPLGEPEAGERTRELAAMIDGAGSFGIRKLRGLILRNRTERWAEDRIEEIRAGKLEVPEGSGAATIAWHHDLDGELLDAKTAGIELLNLLRPTVAVARFIAFIGLALHEHPGTREWLLEGGVPRPEIDRGIGRAAADGGDGVMEDDDDRLEYFVHEVRRFYPFFPVIGGRVLEPFDWRGHSFRRDDWVLLDLYGTDHDPRIWDEPNTFRPERFRDWDGSAFNFIPQGGGDHYANHRCPGEWITIELMKRAASLLTTAMQYHVPEQDLELDLSRMPAIPRSGFVIYDVRRA